MTDTHERGPHGGGVIDEAGDITREQWNAILRRQEPAMPIAMVNDNTPPASRTTTQRGQAVGVS